MNDSDLAPRFAEFRTTVQRLTTEVQRAIVGYDELIADCLTAVF